MYQQGNYYQLPVKGIITENRRSYYVVTAEGREHIVPIFEFQKGDPKPETLSCFVKDVREGIPVFIQDLRPLYRRIYTKNEVFAFRVKNSFQYTSRPYYEVVDRNNLVFRLYVKKSEKLALQQRVECRVTGFTTETVELELVKREGKSSGLPFFELDDLQRELNLDGKLVGFLRENFKRIGVLGEAFESYNLGNDDWMMQVIGVLDRELLKWVMSVYNRPYLNLLGAFRRVCLFFLEDSNLLVGCEETEQRSYRELLTRALQHMEIVQEAVTLIDGDRQEEAVDEILGKMRNSGYLYEPGRKLKVMMALFILDSGLMNSKIDALFDTILRGNTERWMEEPFRGAFIEMLDGYVEYNRERVDGAYDLDNGGNLREWNKMVKALAVLLLLVNERDNYDRQLRRAMFYRYLSYMDTAKADVLLEKAFCCLTEAEQSALEITWRDAVDPTVMALHCGVDNLRGLNPDRAVRQVYNGAYAQLVIANRTLEIRPTRPTRKMGAMLPEGLLRWHRMQVYQNDAVVAPKEGVRDLAAYRVFWRALEQGVQSASSEMLLEKRKVRKMLPDPGDVVLIRVKYADANIPDCYVVEVEDPSFFGVGRLMMRDVVRYRVSGTERMFRDEEDRPYLLRAKVQSVDADGCIHFDMMGLLNGFVRDCVSTGDETNCVVTDFSYNVLRCVSENGYTIQIANTGMAVVPEVGACIRVRIVNARPNGLIEGEIVGPTGVEVNTREAFETLICSYAEEQVYEGENLVDDVMLHSEVTMEDCYVRELVLLLDRRADLEGSHFDAYNCLAFDRLLAIMLKDKEMATYLADRMTLLQQLQFFGINSAMEASKLAEVAEHVRMNGERFANLRTRYQLLQMVAFLNHEEQNGELWRFIGETRNEMHREIAKMVLGYNLLPYAHFASEREQILRRVNELLHTEVTYETPMSFGIEGQDQEFKTSVVYPPNNSMRPDLTTQTGEIMRVIAGFMNAEGGTLYIGVNNQGVASGIQDDIDFFKSYDKFDLHVRNNIVSYLGKIANALVRTELIQAGSRQVYKITINKCYKPVLMNGVCFQRQGSSTWNLKGEDLRLFREERKILENKVLSEAKEASKRRTEELALATEQETATKEDVAVAENTIKANENKSDSTQKSSDSTRNILAFDSEYLVSETKELTSSESAEVEQPKADEPEAEQPETTVVVRKRSRPKGATSRKKVGASVAPIIRAEEHGITTSLLRENPTHSWEDNYGVNKVCFLHFLPEHEYMITEDEIWQDTELSLCIKTDDEFVVLVYESGGVIRIPVSSIADKKERRKYKRKADNLIFACPVRKTDLLLMDVLCDNNYEHYRLDDIMRIKEGKMTEAGERLTSMENAGVVLCEILAKEHSDALQRIYNSAPTQLGNVLDSAWGESEMNYINKVLGR